MSDLGETSGRLCSLPPLRSTAEAFDSETGPVTSSSLYEPGPGREPTFDQARLNHSQHIDNSATRAATRRDSCPVPATQFHEMGTQPSRRTRRQPIGAVREWRLVVCEAGVVDKQGELGAVVEVEFG